MTEIVRPLGQARSALSPGQGVFPVPRPCDAVGGSVHVVAGLVPEKSTVRCHVEPVTDRLAAIDAEIERLTRLRGRLAQRTGRV
ncbi:hypothetical protein [Streptomyces griseoluteus]|uniref:hypothetical protein n=1 Tax=Streptomyces griseoluteus TaxID=29306 RepID=UPI00167722B3|nr:hypothetical protein [Streptomyces griseoluteus]